MTAIHLEREVPGTKIVYSNLLITISTTNNGNKEKTLPQIHGFAKKKKKFSDSHENAVLDYTNRIKIPFALIHSNKMLYKLSSSFKTQNMTSVIFISNLNDTHEKESPGVKPVRAICTVSLNFI